MRMLGLIVIFAAFCVPIFWFANLASQHDLPALFSQYLGVCALIAMAFSQVLATRLAWLQTIFGGMDRMYVLHKWLGISALALVLLHDTIDADMDGIGRETFLTDIAETLGEISLYGFLILVTLSIATFIPYNLWKYTHKLMGGFFAASTFHFLFILKPFSNLDALGIYVVSFCAVGILSYAYTLLPIGAFKGWRRYEVRSVEPAGDAVSVTLSPAGAGHRHRSGQFAFVSFSAPDLEEVHPFTISKAPDDTGTLRFTIKPLGDYTANLCHALKAGTNVQVSRPFGHFALDKSSRERIWIAAGIGITPFLAWSHALKGTEGPVHLFYCIRTRSAAAHLDELEEIAAAKHNLHVHLIETQKDGRLTPAKIDSVVTGGKHDVEVAFCGPVEMRRAFSQGLASLGYDTRRFRYEEFEIRSGLGIRRFANWLMSRIRGRAEDRRQTI